MASADVKERVSEIITTLEATKKAYNIIQGDKTLPETSHEAGRGLEIARTALQTANSRLETPDQAGVTPKAISTLKDCNSKTKQCLDIFEKVSKAPEASRADCYITFVTKSGRENLVEVLLIGIMEDTWTLAKESAIEAAMEPQIKALRDAIDTLSKMKPSVPADESRNTHSGSGDQYNAMGGIQNNNNGSGHQFPGATFGGPVTF